MANTVEPLENNVNEVKWDVASNIARLEEAETRIMSTEYKLEIAVADLTYLESKVDDLENRSRRKNLQIFGLREGEE